MHRMILYTLFAASCVIADEIIYADNSLTSGWQDRSWGSTIVYNATDTKKGSTSISVDSTPNSAFSLYSDSIFSTFAGLKFDLAVRTHVNPLRELI